MVWEGGRVWNGLTVVVVDVLVLLVVAWDQLADVAEFDPVSKPPSLLSGTW